MEYQGQPVLQSGSGQPLFISSAFILAHIKMSCTKRTKRLDPPGVEVEEEEFGLVVSLPFSESLMIRFDWSFFEAKCWA